MLANHLARILWVYTRPLSGWLTLGRPVKNFADTLELQKSCVAILPQKKLRVLKPFHVLGVTPKNKNKTNHIVTPT